MVGQTQVLEVDTERRRIGLSRKKTLPDPMAAFAKAHPAGETLTGKVTNVTDFGIFLQVAEGIEGLLHRGDLSWTESDPDMSAYEAGAELMDLEFTQFHPTGLVWPPSVGISMP